MRLISYKCSEGSGLAVKRADGSYCGFTSLDEQYPGSLRALLGGDAEKLVAGRNVLLTAPPLDLEEIEFLPPLDDARKIICIGLNYLDHSAESGFNPPEYPAVFARFNSSLVGHMQPIVMPAVSKQLDYEGEIAAIVGKAGRHIAKGHALEHIAGYALFNDASIRDYQFKSPQWTVGKNFDATGAFGPEFISADELPPGCKGLHFETRLNEVVVQKAAIDDLIFDVASLVSILSEVMTLSPGDIIVTGTPGGVGLARKPPLWMKPDDVCVISSDVLGTLRNPIVGERARIDPEKA